jgi:hypothetical protein
MAMLCNSYELSTVLSHFSVFFFFFCSKNIGGIFKLLNFISLYPIEKFWEYLRYVIEKVHETTELVAFSLFNWLLCYLMTLLPN